MKPEEMRWRELLAQVQDGVLATDAAVQEITNALREKPFEGLQNDGLEFARVDHHRALRQGFPEVVFGAGKTPAQVAAISQAIVARGSTLLVTRADSKMFETVKTKVPAAQYHEIARIIAISSHEQNAFHDTVGVLCAGTSDLPVAEEAAVTLEVLGASVQRFCDIGVAGLHRTLASLQQIRACRVLIVVAGMEGALPSVIGGLVDSPVIAVPTSVGYGASFGGIAALLGMLNSCASGLSVVNIDNGFGAAMCAARILSTFASKE